MSWVAAGVGSGVAAQGSVSAFRSLKEASKARAGSEQLQTANIVLMIQQLQKFDRLIADYPRQTKEMLGNITASYVDLQAMVDQAKTDGDEELALIFQSQRDLVSTHLTAELEAIGANKDELLSTIQEFSDSALEYAMQDEDARDRLRAEYKKEADRAVGNLNKMADASAQRIDSILKTGLPEGAAANISKVSQGVADLKRKTSELEAARGKGGSASRSTAVDLEGLKIIGETTANLKAQAIGEMVQASQVQRQLLGAAGERMSMLQPTRGAALAEAQKPFQEASVRAIGEAGVRSLTSLANANVETRRLTGAEGEASLAREDQYLRDRMSLRQGQLAAETRVKEREQDLISAATAGQAVQSRSMADILSAQSQNYSNMAKEATSRADVGAANANRGLVNAIGGVSDYFNNSNSNSNSNNSMGGAPAFHQYQTGASNVDPSVSSPSNTGSFNVATQNPSSIGTFKVTGK